MGELGLAWGWGGTFLYVFQLVVLWSLSLFLVLVSVPGFWSSVSQIRIMKSLSLSLVLVAVPGLCPGFLPGLCPGLCPRLYPGFLPGPCPGLCPGLCPSPFVLVPSWSLCPSPFVLVPNIFWHIIVDFKSNLGVYFPYQTAMQRAHARCMTFSNWQ